VTPDNKDEAAKALAVNQLAGVLSDLELVRWPKRGARWLWVKSELEHLKREGKPWQRHRSYRDPSGLAEKVGRDGWRGWRRSHPRSKPLRNHGLFSKAERALQIAGWSERARNDIEIFRLVDTEGLTPLLMVLNEPARAG
jgi:hypothetical protein